MKNNTCKRCKALKHGSNGPYCELGCKISEDVNGPFPKEPCPKPLTYLDLLECRGECRCGRR